MVDLGESGAGWESPNMIGSGYGLGEVRVRYSLESED